MNEQINKNEDEKRNEINLPRYAPPANYSYPNSNLAPAPFNFNEPVYPRYYPAVRSKPNPLIQILFWFFYLTVALPVSFSLTVALWATALALLIVFPVTVLKQTGVIGGNWVSLGDWLSMQSEALIYGLTGCVSLVGVLLLVFAILTTRPWFGLHRTALRDLGGLNI